jgi:HSP20 family protein
MTHVKFHSRPFDKSINNVVDELLGGLPVLFNEGFSSLSRQGYAPVNIKETPASFILELVAPGMEKGDLKINLDGNILTIAAEKKAEVKDETNKQIRREYSYRSFKRSFTIDEEIDATGIEASYINGVLTLNLPRKAEVKEAAKEITIK